MGEQYIISFVTATFKFDIESVHFNLRLMIILLTTILLVDDIICLQDFIEQISDVVVDRSIIS